MPQQFLYRDGDAAHQIAQGRHTETGWILPERAVEAASRDLEVTGPTTAHPALAATSHEASAGTVALSESETAWSLAVWAIPGSVALP